MTELFKRSLTSIVLLLILAGAYWWLSPAHLAIAIKCVYAYAFIFEYLPLAHRSAKKAPFATLFAGCALVLTGLVHAMWARRLFTHFRLGLCILTAILSDMGGYIVGKLYGKHPLAPKISPKKTWEGLIGSILLTSIVITTITYIYSYRAINASLVMIFWSITSAIAALLGDLLFSYLKRTAGVKDTGNLLPGHGGLLDRLDSIIGTTMAWLLGYVLLSQLSFLF